MRLWPIIGTIASNLRTLADLARGVTDVTRKIVIRVWQRKVLVVGDYGRRTYAPKLGFEQPQCVEQVQYREPGNDGFDAAAAAANNLQFEQFEQ